MKEYLAFNGKNTLEIPPGTFDNITISPKVFEWLFNELEFEEARKHIGLRQLVEFTTTPVLKNEVKKKGIELLDLGMLVLNKTGKKGWEFLFK